MPEPEPTPVAAAVPEPEPPATASNEPVDESGEEPIEEPPDDRELDHLPSPFDAALESLQRRMERAHLEPAFVRGLLVPESIIDVSEVSMRWAGMPNKHERALTTEVFFALAEAGFLAPRADGRYRVLRAAD